MGVYLLGGFVEWVVVLSVLVFEIFDVMLWELVVLVESLVNVVYVLC